MKINIFWFRRDLRIFDNHGFYIALKSGLPVLPVFIFDPDILSKLGNQSDARVSFIYENLQKLTSAFGEKGSTLLVFNGYAAEAFDKITTAYSIESVFVNHDYEPFAIKRDLKIRNLLESKGIKFKSFKDQVIFEKNDILKQDGNPYTVFTPYSQKWKQNLNLCLAESYPSEKYLQNLLKINPLPLPPLEELGFNPAKTHFPSNRIPVEKIANYASTRNYPAVEGTTGLGIHLRFGTISIRELVRVARDISETFLNELIWREFFMQILWHFNFVESRAFKPAYNFINWRNDEREFKRWCEGTTGYPLVDAGMRELSETGFMHNRVRMVTAGFLTKHLLIDWRWGEAWFAEKLTDFELSSNNGNWQWAASCGCDAAPYFRIFNPESQQKKFDPKGEYIQKWAPGAGTFSYPAPMVEHDFARKRALETYKSGLLRK